MKINKQITSPTKRKLLSLLMFKLIPSLNNKSSKENLISVITVRVCIHFY
jgi:hypothetical protein